MAAKATQSIAVLDIGSSKVACFIASYSKESGLQVDGIGHQISHGIQGGVITHIKEAQHSVLSAVAAAEKMAGRNVDNVIVNVSGSKLLSHFVEADIFIGQQTVADRDLRKLLQKALSKCEQAGQDVVHVSPLDYRIDDIPGIADARGMCGDVLGVRLLVVTIPASVVLNITRCLADCHLNIRNFVAGAYAAGLACVKEDERKIGAMVIDIGGGTTEVSLFHEGRLLYSFVLPVGGMHITKDITCGLSTKIEDAERVKILYGGVTSGLSDDKEFLDVSRTDDSAGEEDAAPASRSQLISIIEPRVEEILELVQIHLEQRGLQHAGGKLVVITGGSSQLPGLKDYAEKMLGKQVRIGYTPDIEGVAESTKSPAFSTVAGMLLYAVQAPGTLPSAIKQSPIKRITTCMGEWVKENF